MMEKNTNQLLHELMDTNDLDRILSENTASFRAGSLPHALQALFEARDTTKSALAKASGISEVYLHQVFSGRRTPSRDRLLCLCIGLHTSLEEAQSLLVQAHHAPLYPREQRDAILIYGLSHGLTLPEVNDALLRSRRRRSADCRRSIQQKSRPLVGTSAVLYRLGDLLTEWSS